MKMGTTIGMKVNASGSEYLYSTFLGGSGDDAAWGIALGSDKSAYVTGYTNSGNPVSTSVSAAAKAFLTSCATDASHYYDATTEVALQAAFRDIALKISTLRLTN